MDIFPVLWIMASIVIAVVIFDFYLASPPNPAGSMLAGTFIAFVFLVCVVAFQQREAIIRFITLS